MQSYTHCCEMMLLCLSLMLLCVSANSDNIMMFKASGENITVKCSCNNGTEGIVAMYLFHHNEDNKEDNEVVFCNDKGSPKMRPKYQNRAQISGSLMDRTITITNLTVDDSGVFRCIYKNGVLVHFCKMTYTVFVKGVAPCPSAEVPPAQIFTFSVTCVIGALATVIAILLILLIYRKVKRSSRRRRQDLQVSNEYVYEVMTKKDSITPP